MLTLCSFLQGVFTFVKSLAVKVAKNDYRQKAVMVLAGCVVTAVTFTSSGFGGGGKNVLTVFAETTPDDGEETEEAPEEIENLTEADMQNALTDSRLQGQQVVGQLLAQDIREQEEEQNLVQEEVAEVREEIRLEEEARRKAEEEARKKAEEEEARRIAEEEAKRQAEEERKARGLVNYTDEDYQVLLKIVQAEAGICDAKGKILVADVILNRVRSDEFPNTITEVVYQREQFSPVSDGSLYTCSVTDETVECVNRALEGEDYSQGALYFMNRRGARARSIRWFDGKLTFLFQHGGHEFFK